MGILLNIIMSVLPMYSSVSLDACIHKKFTVLLYNFESNYNNNLVIMTITILFAGIDILQIKIIILDQMYSTLSNTITNKAD